MKKCPHCGKELPQEMQFCPYCMEKLIPETPVGEVPPRGRRRWWPWLIAAVILLLLLLWLLWRLLPIAVDSDATAQESRHTSATVTRGTDEQSGTDAIHSAATTTATTQTGGAETTHGTITKGDSTIGRNTATTAPYSTITKGDSTTGHNTAAQTTAPDPCAVGHDWAPITKTVHVDEVGHYDTVTNEEKVTLFKCALCYEDFTDLTEYYTHFDTHLSSGDGLQEIFRDRYETVTEYREVTKKVWVVDTPAHEQTVTVGRRCRVCEKTETDEDKE